MDENDSSVAYEFTDNMNVSKLTTHTNAKPSGSYIMRMFHSLYIGFTHIQNGTLTSSVMAEHNIYHYCSVLFACIAGIIGMNMVIQYLNEKDIPLFGEKPLQNSNNADAMSTSSNISGMSRQSLITNHN